MATLIIRYLQLLVCRPNIVHDGFWPADMIRMRQITENSDLYKLWQQGESGDTWEELGDALWQKKEWRIQAVTAYDDIPGITRHNIPSVIYFNKAFIEQQRSRDPPFSSWSKELFADVSKKDAVKRYKEKGKGKAEDGTDAEHCPADALYESSFHRCLFHEVCHDTLTDSTMLSR